MALIFLKSVCQLSIECLNHSLYVNPVATPRSVLWRQGLDGNESLGFLEGITIGKDQWGATEGPLYWLRWSTSNCPNVGFRRLSNLQISSQKIFNYTNYRLQCLKDQEKGNSPVPEPRGAGRAMRIQQLATSVKMSGLRHAAGPRTRRI